METLGYYNGKYGELSEMTVPMLDRVCYFGDGVYDATHARNHKIYCLDEHVDRFFNSAGLLRMTVPHTKEELKELLREMVSKVDADEQFVYWQLTRGTAPRNHAFPEAPANLWIMLRPAPTQDMRVPVRLITLEDTRFLHCNIKTLNLLPNVMAAQRAEEAGCDEAVLHRGESVTECAHSNVHILKDGVFRTHPTDHYILPGITRMRLIQLCHRLNIPVDEAPFTLAELRAADEILVTSASTFCRAACELDGQPVGGKDPALLKRIQDALDEDFHRETDL
ncbi:MAG: D-amino acid aminotransferase [Oscillospiraceae bacterium]|nr:D-amino acid aminotransferase [Oscillospiraceae bacterium]